MRYLFLVLFVAVTSFSFGQTRDTLRTFFLVADTANLKATQVMRGFTILKFYTPTDSTRSTCLEGATPIPCPTNNTAVVGYYDSTRAPLSGRLRVLQSRYTDPRPTTADDDTTANSRNAFTPLLPFLTAVMKESGYVAFKIPTNFKPDNSLVRFFRGNNFTRKPMDFEPYSVVGGYLTHRNIIDFLFDEYAKVNPSARLQQ